MVGRQYTPQQRAFMAAQYNRRSGTRDFVPLIVRDFLIRFPGAMPPSKQTILRQAKKLDLHATLHLLRSKIRPLEKILG